MKTIVFTHAAARDFDNLPPEARETVQTGLIRYATTGAGDKKQLVGRNGCRLRIGRYRVLFDEDESTILAVYIGKRETTTYRRQGKGQSMNRIQIIRSPSGDELVVLPRAEYDSLLAAAIDEDAADVALYDERKAELASGTGEVLPAEVSALILRGDSRLKAVRRWRNITQSDLAAKAGIRQGYLSDIESRRRAGAPETIRKLADALDVPVIWLN